MTVVADLHVTVVIAGVETLGIGARIVEVVKARMMQPVAVAALVLSLPVGGIVVLAVVMVLVVMRQRCDTGDSGGRKQRVALVIAVIVRRSGSGIGESERAQSKHSETVRISHGLSCLLSSR